MRAIRNEGAVLHFRQMPFKETAERILKGKGKRAQLDYIINVLAQAYALDITRAEVARIFGVTYRAACYWDDRLKEKAALFWGAGYVHKRRRF